MSLTPTLAIDPMPTIVQLVLNTPLYIEVCTGANTCNIYDSPPCIANTDAASKYYDQQQGIIRISRSVQLTQGTVVKAIGVMDQPGNILVCVTNVNWTVPANDIYTIYFEYKIYQPQIQT